MKRSRGKRQEPTCAPRENGRRTEEGRIPSDDTDHLNLILRIWRTFSTEPGEATADTETSARSPGPRSISVSAAISG